MMYLYQKGIIYWIFILTALPFSYFYFDTVDVHDCDNRYKHHLMTDTMKQIMIDDCHEMTWEERESQDLGLWSVILLSMVLIPSGLAVAVRSVKDFRSLKG